MPSTLSHAVVGLAVGAWCRPATSAPRVLLIAAACAAAPDLDLIGWALQIPNDSVFGHRALSHSLTAAVALGALAAWLAWRGERDNERTATRAAWLMTMFAIATASHGVFDAMTTYSLGIGFFAPFSLHRYRFAWQPLTDAFTAGFLRGVGNEVLWMLLPATVAVIAGLRLRPPRRPGVPSTVASR